MMATTSSESPGEHASPRLSTPSWRDPRLLAGIIIVLVSVAGVVALISAQDQRQQIYVADRHMTPGEVVTASDLRISHVQLEGSFTHYLSPDSGIPEGSRALNRVEEGELIPLRVLAETDPEGRQAITVDIQHELASSVVPGGPVDVWASTPAAGEDPVDVALIVSRAEVADIRETESAFGAQSSRTVELLVDPEELPGLLATLGSGAALSVLPAGEES